MGNFNMDITKFKQSSNINDLIDIMALLRDPQLGCPWDVEQTCESIIPYTIEEVYEVVDAIRRQDPIDLCDELGDLLLQVVFYAQICSEKKLFSFGNVVEAVTAKMIRRHPYVFGTLEERQQGVQRGQWQRIKQQEKQERDAKKRALNISITAHHSILDDVATVFPAPIEAIKLQEKAAKVGFDWPKMTQVLEKLKEETDEIETAISENNQADMEAELGDIYFTLINLARKLNINPEQALMRTNIKFRQRFLYLEQEIAKTQQELATCPLEQMEAYWQEAKSL